MDIYVWNEKDFDFLLYNMTKETGSITAGEFITELMERAKEQENDDGDCILVNLYNLYQFITEHFTDK